MRKHLLWLLLLLLASCKTQVAGLQQDPSFTEDSFRAHPIVIAGAVDVSQAVDANQVIHQGELLQQSLVKMQKGVKLISTRSLVEKIGQQDMLQLWQGYQKQGVFPEPVMQKIHQQFPQARYLMIAKVIRNQPRQYRETSEEDVVDEMGNPTNRYRKIIAQVAERMMSVSLLVYDMKTKVRAWYGRVDDGDSVANESSDTFRKDNSFSESVTAGLVSGFVGNLTGGVLGLAEPDMPPVPPVDPILMRIYEGFAENMPD
ncbi:hypothetical protein [Ghiorsea bivora]|uniref:hypothetical protein n=1 Tax=Ghiorsea bivora TaxID=1485545 RepID=UPI00056DDFE9|nr:hypothetical protein [Ghiorsea bivora]